jgi:hypothetical protein
MVADGKTSRCANKALIIDVTRYLDKFKYKWFNKIKYV